MPWPDLTEEEQAWIKEHGCIHGMYPDEGVLFCPTCQPDLTELKALLRKKCKERGISCDLPK
jgi:hypothetical protein